MNAARSPRIGLDARKLADYGIGTYVRELVREYARLQGPQEFVLFAPEEVRSSLEGLPARFRLEPVSALGYSLREHVALPAAARRAGIDLFHAPHYVLPIGLGVPAVVTIHDVIHLLFPELFRHPLARPYARFFVARAVRRAARVIAVSERTKADLVATVGADPAKITVIPNGVDERFRAVLPREEISARLAPLGLRPPYLLFLGNPKPHKNLPVLLAAWRSLRDAGSAPPPLVLAGARREGEERLRALARAAGIEDGVRVLPFVDEAALPALYQGATLFVLPSLYEGFGLPAVEAMASGTPVVAARAGALPEIAGEAASLFPPRDAEALAAALDRLLRDPGARRALAEAGRRRAERFRWSETARLTLAVYDQALEDAAARGAAG